ncbi:hypothetical protein N9W34_04740 [Rickettsiales bacterium]|nr:hypothetical protein [Rickettsiales bacterium]
MWLLLRKFIFFICLAGLLSACGFRPLHGDHEAAQKDIELLKSVEIPPISGKIGQDFRRKLSEIINPSRTYSESIYRLEVNLNKDSIPLAIERNRIVTRYKLIVRANYKLIRIADNKVIDSGELSRDGGYDKVSSDYATYISEEYTTKTVAEALAEDMRLQLTSVLFEQ